MKIDKNLLFFTDFLLHFPFWRGSILDFYKIFFGKIPSFSSGTVLRGDHTTIATAPFCTDFLQIFGRQTKKISDPRWYRTRFLHTIGETFFFEGGWCWRGAYNNSYGTYNFGDPVKNTYFKRICHFLYAQLGIPTHKIKKNMSLFVRSVRKYPKLYIF